MIKRECGSQILGPSHGKTCKCFLVVLGEVKDQDTGAGVLGGSVRGGSQGFQKTQGVSTVRYQVGKTT